MISENQEIILVNEQDEEIGCAEKMYAHQRGLLHRAFSVFIFCRDGEGIELLLQKRQYDKYHSAGLWTNTCCSHPVKGETIYQAATRRLQEEMGMQAPLIEAGCFHYRADFNNGMIENEIDHVLISFIEKTSPEINPNEAAACRWVTLSDLSEELRTSSENFTYWFKQALDIALASEAFKTETNND